MKLFIYSYHSFAQPHKGLEHIIDKYEYRFMNTGAIDVIHYFDEEYNFL